MRPVLAAGAQASGGVDSSGVEPSTSVRSLPARLVPAGLGTQLPARLSPTYWHGGPAGLSVGDHVLPPVVTGTPHALTGRLGGGDGPAVLWERVSVSVRYEVAEVFAALSEGEGCVYRVLPEGSLGVDPDSPEDSWTCSRARVVSVHPLDATTVARILKALLREGRS